MRRAEAEELYIWICCVCLLNEGELRLAGTATRIPEVENDRLLCLKGFAQLILLTIAIGEDEVSYNLTYSVGGRASSRLVNYL